MNLPRYATYDAIDMCKAYPYNPVTGQCVSANLAHTRIVVNATDGKNPLSQVSIRAVQACAPKKLLASLPSHATGVAGLASSGLALPAQIAASHNVAKKFMLCLPRRGDGVAVFGGGPLFLLPQSGTNGELTSTLAYTPLKSRKDNPMYYILVQGVAMDHAQVALPAYALANGGAVFCTRVPFTLLRPDVYRPVADAFAKALGRDDARAPAVSSFELCYKSSMLGNTRLGYAVPSIVLMLEGGKNWTVSAGNSMVDVNDKTACLAFVEMKGVKAGDGNAPAVLIGGFQMENNLVQFDLEKGQLGCKCTAHPHNPFSGKTATDDLTRTTLSANATDGKNPLYPVSFSAVTTCAPSSLLANLPAGAVGVAGLTSSKLALPAQVSRTQKVAKKFLLCLPRSGLREGPGVAIFGGGPLFTLVSVSPPSGGPDLTLSLTYTSLITKRHNPAYYLPVKSIAVGKSKLQLPGDALTTGGVVFSTRVPYTTLRPDVYRPLLDALDKASGWSAFRVPAVAPFELCYNTSFLPNTRIGHLAPDIDFVLQDGQNYTFGSLDSMIDLDNFRTSCFALVQMKPGKGGYAGAPAVEIGGFQMEDNVLQFDLEKMQLDRSRCKCTPHPHNPFSGKTETGDLTRTTLSANATDGMNPLHPVSFSAVTSCAPDSLLANLPAGTVGVAALASSRLALPAQVARAQLVASKFLLCLPRRETEGVAIFGDSPFFTAPSGPVDLTSSLTYTSLHTKLNSPAHYISAKAIAVGKALVLLPVDALATGGVVFSTRAPYTALRPDVYRPVVDAFDKASGWNDLKVPAVPPFELCYDARRLPNTIIGRLAPDIDLMLGDGKNYSFGSFESMVEVQQPRGSCFAFVEMNVDKGGYGAAPIMEIGGFQMENNLLQFDLEKMLLGFAKADDEDRFRCKCTAHPHNPFSGETATDDLTRTTLSANATDGKNPLYPVSFSAVASCAPEFLLAKLPAGAAGVAGLARAKLALQAQVARTQKVANKFALCLPSGGQGVAIFGGGPLLLLPPGRPDVTAGLAGETPLRRNPDFPGYFISAKGIAVNQEQVPLSSQGPLVVGLSTRIPYTVLRPDVYTPFVKAFDKATAERKRAPAVAPFELCYDSQELGSTRLGYAVPQVDLMLEGGSNWTVFGGNSMVQVNDNTACFGFLKMKEDKGGRYGSAPAPAVVIGGFQMENNLLVFDEDKAQLGFSGLLFGRQTTCSNFNFTMAA
ncbi:hypothetical protein EJB05_16542, partial [Eragrostis curvula]